MFDDEKQGVIFIGFSSDFSIDPCPLFTAIDDWREVKGSNRTVRRTAVNSKFRTEL